MAGDLELYIWNYNHSSWSMRAGIPLRQTGVKFREIVAHNAPEGLAAVKAKTPTGLLPALVLGEGGQVIWDSLAIAEFLAEEFPDAGLWPKDKAARAHARSMVAEMHSGFTALRSALPMNIKGSFEGFKVWARAQADIERIGTIWHECLETYGGPYLFGETPGMADAMYAPVVTRFRTYDVKLDSVCAAYSRRIMALAPMREWVEAAVSEPEQIDELDAEF